MFNRSNSPGFKWRPRLEIYTDGVNNTFNPDSFSAVSYNWWVYCKKINGLVVFNNAYYSSQTSGHQANMLELLKKLKIKVDVTVYTTSSLHSLEGDLSSLYKALFALEIASKRSKRDMVYVPELRKHFKTRQAAILAMKANIKALRSIGATNTTSVKDLKASVIADDNKRLAHAREKSRQAREARKPLQTTMNRLAPLDLSAYSGLNDYSDIGF